MATYTANVAGFTVSPTAFMSTTYMNTGSVGTNQLTVTDGNPSDTTFSVGDTLTYSFDGIVDDQATYEGMFNGGFVLQDTTVGGGAFLYFGSGPPAPMGQQFTVDTDPFTTCFLAGTLIATPDGERPVETLAIGDSVLTSDGEVRPLRWIGRQTVVSMFSDKLRSFPIRIMAGGLADNVPMRDLCVSPGHALLIDGLLVHAGALVNGLSVVRIEQPEPQFVYYHIELADHSLILAEGAPAETFVNNVTRRHFDNYAQYEALFGEHGMPICEIDVPRVLSRRQMPYAMREKLAARAAALAPKADMAA